MIRERQTLHDGWTLQLDREAMAELGTEAKQVAATVPGCVHTDLMAAGLLEDPLLERNEAGQHWIGRADWTFHVAFDAEAAQDAERVDLVCDGLDTIATVVLNQTQLGRTENQHRTYRFDVGGVLRTGSNELEVRFESPVAFAAAQRDSVGDLPNPYGEPYNFIRKMACNFGWDWGPQLTTSGVWRPISLERWRTARFAAVRPSPVLSSPSPVEGEGARVDVMIELERSEACAAAGRATVDAVLMSPDGDVVATATQAADDESVFVSVDAESVRRWWPAGRGDQPLYQLDLVLTIDGQIVDRASRRIGFRHVQLDTTADPGGGARFEFLVNGERTWIRGFNWVPDDCFLPRVTRERVRTRIDQALEANANLLRVWGGGIYESDDFYECCDERGMLVWQDFAFACAAYPEELLSAEVTAEATDNVDRLMSHPSLLVWNGNNECFVGWHDWGWPELLGDRPWGETFYRELLPHVTSSLDPMRPYIDGSPTSLDAPKPPNDASHGTVHLWDIWNEQDYSHYRDHRPRFVAEFGFQAPPAFATFQRALSNRPLTISDPGVLFHQRAFDGHAKLDRWLERHVGRIDDYDDWLFSTQLNQAHAISLGIGHFRSLRDHCAGTVWWQLNDCWAAVSWSVVDGDGRLKPAWYAMRRAFADRLAVIEPDGEELVLVVINDGRDDWHDTAVLERVSADGLVLRTGTLGFSVPAGSAKRLDFPAHLGSSTGAAQGDDDLLVVSISGLRVVHSAVLERDRRDVPRWDVDASTSPGTIMVDVTARTLVRDLCLFADRVDPHAGVDDQLITLLPGETHRFIVSTNLTDRALWIDALGHSGAPSLVLRASGDRRSTGGPLRPVAEISQELASS